MIRKDRKHEPSCVAEESHKKNSYGQGLLTDNYIDQMHRGTDFLGSNSQMEEESL